MAHSYFSPLRLTPVNRLSSCVRIAILFQLREFIRERSAGAITATGGLLRKYLLNVDLSLSARNPEEYDICRKAKVSSSHFISLCSVRGFPFEVNSCPYICQLYHNWQGSTQYSYHCTENCTGFTTEANPTQLL